MACPILFRLENPTSRSDTVGDGAGEICHEAGTITFCRKATSGLAAPGPRRTEPAGQCFAPLAVRIDPSGRLLDSFIDLNNLRFSRFHVPRRRRASAMERC
jgi:hypothetical protein